MQTITIQLTIGTSSTDWKGVAGDTLKISIANFINPEIGRAMENVVTSIKTSRFTPCASGNLCYIEKIKMDTDTSKIEATLPRNIIGTMEILINQYSPDAADSSYLFNFKQVSFIHSSSKLLFRFGTTIPKDFADNAAGVRNFARLPTNLSDLSMTIDRATTKVGTPTYTK